MKQFKAFHDQTFSNFIATASNITVIQFMDHRPKPIDLFRQNIGLFIFTSSKWTQLTGCQDLPPHIPMPPPKEKA